MENNRDMLDTLHRPMRDLRISLTDKCNFRCVYCMPKEVFGDNYRFLQENQQLTFAELERLVDIFVSLGVKKVRLTGGEPLMRKGVHQFIERLLLIDGIEDIGLTTNGYLLKHYAEKLWAAGLRRLNISLDALDPDVFMQMNGQGIKPEVVLENIDFARKIGFDLKINMVVQKGINDGEIIPLARYCKQRGIILRFIEFMDVGNVNGWHMEKVMCQKEIMTILQEQFELEPLPPAYFGEVAVRYKYTDQQGEIGFISSISETFCMSCTRARLSSDGQLYTCLFATKGDDLRSLIRSGKSDHELREKIASIWLGRDDQYSADRMNKRKTIKNKIDMSYIGG